MQKGKEPYLSIYKLVGFYPDNVKLYQQAFLHRSSSVEDSEGRWVNNERLEFLGDAILSGVIADIVYEHFQDRGEGFLTNMRSKIVSRESMNQIAKQLELDKMLHFSVHHPVPESHNSNMLGNALEALIGAIYLDKGFDYCFRFIRDTMLKTIDLDSLSEKEVNFKSNLIEWSQKHRIPIHFDVIENFVDEQGSPVFQSAVFLSDTNEQIGVGIGYPKKESHQQASQMAIKKIRTDRMFMEHIRELKRNRKAAAEQEKASVNESVEEISEQANAEVVETPAAITQAEETNNTITSQEEQN